MELTEHHSHDEDVRKKMQLLEDAPVLCKIGKFHALLICGAAAVSITDIMAPTAISYILPAAECDLNMTLNQKGLVSSMPFLGQLIASLFIGFLSDAFGRKWFIAYGLLAAYVCQIIGAMSQNFWTLTSVKFLEGVLIPCYYPSSTVMMTEMIHKSARTRVSSIKTVLTTVPLIVTPLLSWAVLPHNWDIVIIEGYFELHSWNFYLALSSLVSLFGGIIFLYLPESPKYLLTHGQEDEALLVLKKIYAMNTGNHMDSFPMSTLKIRPEFEPPRGRGSLKKQLVHAIFEVKSLFKPPLLGRLLIFSAMGLISLLTFNGLRPWFPQLTTIVENYISNHEKPDRFCTMISDYTDSLMEHKNNIEANFTAAIPHSTICIPNISGTSTYISGLILGFISIVLMGVTLYGINTIGLKPVMFLLFILSAVCSGALYWTSTIVEIGFMFALISGFMQAIYSFMLNVSCQVFPTTLRALSNTIIVMAGRIGAIIGALMFPVLLRVSCMTPFGVLALLILCVTSMVFFIPNPENESGEK